MTRRITLTLDFALETQGDGTPQQFAEALADELELVVPSACVPLEGVPVGEWPSATVTAVRVNRASEQEAA